MCFGVLRVRFASSFEQVPSRGTLPRSRQHLSAKEQRRRTVWSVGQSQLGVQRRAAIVALAQRHAPDGNHHIRTAERQVFERREELFRARIVVLLERRRHLLQLWLRVIAVAAGENCGTYRDKNWKDHYSRTFRIWSAATCRSTCRLPLGQRSSISRTLASPPRPKCARLSDELRYPTEVCLSLIHISEP